MEVRQFFTYLCAHYYGRLAEWLGNGLQNRVRRFESAIDLISLLLRNFLELKTLDIQGFFFFSISGNKEK